MNDIIIYPAADGKTSVQLRVQGGSVWLTQNEIAELFQTSKQNVNLHISNVLEEKELKKKSVIKDSLTVRITGNLRDKADAQR
ncbi:MAG: DNA-binding protein [Verrucomicrobiota bacterium]